MSQLSAKELHLSYESDPVIHNINLSIPKGKVSVLIGANGCGKSTLLRSLARLMQPKQGTVYLDGKEIHKQPSKEVAQKLAILPQGPQAPEGLTVKELCYFGRHPYKGLFSRNSKTDHDMVEWAVSATGMWDLRDRTLDTLSGGQRQRAWISMALGQGTDLLLLDEPTTYLDIAHQIEVLELLRGLNKEFGKTIVMVLHDLNQAARYADHLICLANGKIHNEGPPKEVFTCGMIREVFGLECCIIEDPVGKNPMCIPMGMNPMCNKKPSSAC